MRRIIFIGNCQIQVLVHIYQQFIAPRTGDETIFIPNYEKIDDKNRNSLETADLVVQQILDFEPRIDLSNLRVSARRHLVPMITAGFLWPLSGKAHVRNKAYPFLPSGPFPGELGDTYLNRQIAVNVQPADGLAKYFDLNINNIINLDRMYELTIKRQRTRDAICGYSIAPLIEKYFKEEQIFLNFSHPNFRIAMSFISQFLSAIDITNDELSAFRQRVRTAPFPSSALPIHPSIATHFNLEYITEKSEYRFHDEGNFTFSEFVIKYLNFDWNQDLAEGIWLSRKQKDDAAVEKLNRAIVKSPKSVAGFLHLAQSLERKGYREEAINALKQAVDIDPVDASIHHYLRTMLLRLGDVKVAEASLRSAIALAQANEGRGDVI